MCCTITYLFITLKVSFLFRVMNVKLVFKISNYFCINRISKYLTLIYLSWIKFHHKYFIIPSLLLFVYTYGSLKRLYLYFLFIHKCLSRNKEIRFLILRDNMSGTSIIRLRLLENRYSSSWQKKCMTN